MARTQRPTSTRTLPPPLLRQRALRRLREAADFLEKGMLEAARLKADLAVQDLDLLDHLESGMTSPRIDQSPTSAGDAEP